MKLRLRTHPPSMWSAYYRQLGEITRSVHTVRGRNFGPVAGPTYRTWSEAITASLDTIAVDLEAAGLDADDVRTVAAAAARHHTVLDEINEPRLLAGDLWLPNTLLRNDAREPTITDVHDLDRTWWGDPASDWTIRMIKAKPDQRQEFWESYGRPDQSDAAIWRSTIYEARHLGSVRLERHRLGNRDGVQNTYPTHRARRPWHDRRTRCRSTAGGWANHPRCRPGRGHRAPTCLTVVAVRCGTAEAP